MPLYPVIIIGIWYIQTGMISFGMAQVYQPSTCVAFCPGSRRLSGQLVAIRGLPFFYWHGGIEIDTERELFCYLFAEQQVLESKPEIYLMPQRPISNHKQRRDGSINPFFCTRIDNNNR